ncbi:hypothetical protein GTG28_20610 [Vibrio sp. OCN044]|uniref:Uncharacterized protein n=1 Tax=Vibrio tetraodonis subsp. pristinus TaxID=2695891 RepID=A0A6L8M256_9VIBR|nr:hypothetical protein [Vibrio tetraodonis]MYM61606.1 hypothetical protein [Vibrio tetraodonis subsp. pristinus]
MDIEQIKAEAPEGAVYWSPVVEQYFDRQCLNIPLKERGKLVQVHKDCRAELVLLTDLLSDDQYFECCRIRDELEERFLDLNAEELRVLSYCGSVIREWEDKHLPF